MMKNNNIKNRNIMKKIFLVGLALMTTTMGFAQKTVPYFSVMADENTRRVDSEWTVINANEDGKRWSYSAYDFFLRDTGYPCGVIYERSFESPKDADDWVVSPAITLEGGKKYKVSWYSLTHGFKEQYELVMAQGNSLAAMTGGDATTVVQITDYMQFHAMDHNFYVVIPETDGDYNFGFHVFSPADAYRLYLNCFTIEDFVLTPAAVTNLKATNEGEELKVNLSWKLPTLDDTNAELAAEDITAVKVYRDEELIATLPGDATTYTDESITVSGFYTYSVAAVAEGEGAAESIKTSYVGPMAAVELPFASDFSDSETVNTYWTFIDGNGDGLTWKYYNEWGTMYLVYANSSTSTVEDDWVISPLMHFPGAGEYKVIWNGYAYNGNMDFWIGTGKTLDQMTMRFGTIDPSQLKSFSRSDKELTLNVPVGGDYTIAIHNNHNPSAGMEYYMYGLKVEIVSITEDPDPTGISEVRGNVANDEYFDLTGRRVVAPRGGIFVHNGKKIVVN